MSEAWKRSLCPKRKRGWGVHLSICEDGRAFLQAPAAAALPSPHPPNLCREAVPATHWSPAWQQLCPQADSQRPAASGKKGPFSGGGEVTRRGPHAHKGRGPQPTLLAAASLSPALSLGETPRGPCLALRGPGGPPWEGGGVGEG